MLEDSKMDKKSINRSSQPQSRASAVDCKKSAELTHKPAPRYNKKREGPASAPKNDPARKNGPAQRGRGQMDRRPRARGSPGFAMGGAEITGIAEDEPELGSVFVPGSKKQNLNHLLNFMYSPRGAQDRRGPAPRRNAPQRAAAIHPHNHDLYLQASCQFVVKEDGEYKANLLDPDVAVKWDLIEEIVVRSTGKSECPICLGEPVAGRVGRCGHVYCWPCALHYAAAHEKQPPPCPVCAAPFHVDQMKPARILQWASPAEEVTMRLVRRLRGSTMVEVAPARGEAAEESEAKVLPLAYIHTAPYAKLFAASTQQVIEKLQQDREELQNQIMAEIDTTEIVYMEQAIESLNLQEEKLKNQKDIEIPKYTVVEKKDEAPTVYEKQVKNDTKIDWFDEEEGASCMESLQAEIDNITLQETINSEETIKSELNPEASEFKIGGIQNEEVAEEFPLIQDDVTPPPSDIDRETQSKYFYFYQAEDGQQVFLHSLNVRLLTASWGHLASAPSVLRARVLHRETLSLVESSRKHMPYAAHLPLHCPFDIVELDLQPPIVTTDAINSHWDALETRARARARSERDEKRRERAYRRAMEGPPKPQFSSSDFPPAYSPPSSYSPPVAVPPVEASPSTTSMARNVAPSPSTLSFAKMASTSGTWRVRPVAPARPETPPPEDEEGAAPRSVSLSDAITAALDARSEPAPKGKKKKGKQKVLFAMGMQHSA
ncbi:unnamed protein product [Plutella xylostella]|uniref:E3 ubiquitin-protein ligase RNF10 n=1 Tax=Plutella xylostella TaxID=51655 RepID=A0A8S4EGK2_PLUXY|nr:unnamed protein product [Plutella xylostella]